jgi:hypothetical protein
LRWDENGGRCAIYDKKNQHGFQQNLSIYVGFPATTAYAAAFRGFPGFPTGLLTGYTSGNQTSQQAFSQDIHQVIKLSKKPTYRIYIR